MSKKDDDYSRDYRRYALETLAHLESSVSGSTKGVEPNAFDDNQMLYYKMQVAADKAQQLVLEKQKG